MSRSRREENRARFPDIAQFIDGLKQVFGEDQVRVVWIHGDGFEAGKRPEWMGEDRSED